MTSGCASPLRAAPFRAASFGAAHSELPILKCLSSREMLRISAVTPQRWCFARSGEAPQDLRAAFPQDTGVSFCARPFRRGSLLWGSWGGSTAGSLIRKSSHFPSGSPTSCPPARCSGFRHCKGNPEPVPWVRLLRDREELQTAPAGLPVFRFIMEDPGCGHGLLRVYRPFLSKELLINKLRK